MIDVRHATPADAPEIVRLRAIMIASLGRIDPDGAWRPLAEASLRERLTPPPEAAGLAVLVVEGDEPGVLAACATGTITDLLGGPGNPDGRLGYVFNVCTDPAYRRRGYSRACMEGLLDWFRLRGVGKIDLTTSAPAEPLYESLGFRRGDPAMRLILPSS